MQFYYARPVTPEHYYGQNVALNPNLKKISSALPQAIFHESLLPVKLICFEMTVQKQRRP